MRRIDRRMLFCPHEIRLSPFVCQATEGKGVTRRFYMIGALLVEGRLASLFSCHPSSCLIIIQVTVQFTLFTHTKIVRTKMESELNHIPIPVPHFQFLVNTQNRPSS